MIILRYEILFQQVTDSLWVQVCDRLMLYLVISLMSRDVCEGEVY